MVEKYLQQYVDELYEKQNINADITQQGLYSKKQYYDLLKPVAQLISKNSSLSLQEMRDYLFRASKIEEKIQEFIYKKEMIPGMVFSYGTNNYKETVIVGNRQEVSLDDNGNLIPNVEEMTEDTIFDLASITKIFTSISILKLVQNKQIKLDDKITKYVPEFKNLKDVTIFDLITFSVPLKTNSRVDKANSKEEAEKILFDIEVDRQSENKRPYTDMGAMVLKYVIERASSMNYYSYIDNNILKPAKMKDTHTAVPKMKLDRVASTNFDGKYYKDGNFSITTNVSKGIVYDPKARIMGQPKGELSGHAGLFSTASDMTNLAKNIINGHIINDKYLEMMVKNRTGRKYLEDGKEKYVQYLGMLCYSKHPILDDSELFHAMSGKSFASAGWTGTQLTVDPINQIYLFMAGNRSHNRMTFIDPSQRDKIETLDSGKKIITLPDGSVKTDATRFAWDKSEVVINPVLNLVIQYKMLEDFYIAFNEKIESKENTKIIEKTK